MDVSITVHLQLFKYPQLRRFSTDLDETDIKIHGLLRTFIWKIEITRILPSSLNWFHGANLALNSDVNQNT